MSTAPAVDPASPPVHRHMTQLPLPIDVEPERGFDNYVRGPNAAAVAHLQALVLPAAPVYLWGPGGCGKTHLLRALAADCHVRGQRVGWFDAARAVPWTMETDWSLVVIDRCDTLCAAAQHAAFTLFVEAVSHGVQVAAAGRLPPVDLPLRDDLRTRLAWGHVFALHPLAEAETRAALRRQADERGIFLPDEVMDHVLTHYPRDLGHLMKLLARLDKFALAKARRLSVALVRQMIEEEGATPPDADLAVDAPSVPAA